MERQAEELKRIICKVNKFVVVFCQFVFFFFFLSRSLPSLLGGETDTALICSSPMHYDFP